MIKKFLVTWYADDNIPYFNEDSGGAIFSWNENLSVHLNNINLDNTNFDEGTPETVIHVRLLTLYSKF